MLALSVWCSYGIEWSGRVVVTRLSAYGVASSMLGTYGVIDCAYSRCHGSSSREHCAPLAAGSILLEEKRLAGCERECCRHGSIFAALM